MKNQPNSRQLYDEIETPNKILEKNQQQKAEVFELEVDDESDDAISSRCRDARAVQ